MALNSQDTNVNQLVINKCTKEQYDSMSSHSSTELYLVEEELDTVVTQNSDNPVTSGAVYNFMQDNKEIIFCHLTDGNIFNETVIECTEVNGEIFDPQELIDRPDDPRPLFPDGNYYYATNTNKVYSGEVGDNEFTDVTVSVMMSGDETKLYCDIDDNKLYRYDGTDFVMVGGGGVTSYNDLTDKPLSVISNKVKYTLEDGTTQYTLAQEGDFVEKAGDTMTGTLILSKTQDASGIANNKPALIIGGTDTQAHIEIDCNEIIAKSNGTTGDKLWLQDGNGALGLAASDYSVSNPDKFLAALSSGVTTKSYPTSGGTFNVYKWGRFCMLSFSTSVSSSYGNLQTIADAAYRPLNNINAVVMAGVSPSQGYYTYISISTAGVISYSHSFYRNGTGAVNGSDATRPIGGTICYISAS